jgi:hypothetical protein
MWFTTLNIGARYIHGYTPPQKKKTNPRENMGRMNIFGILGSQQQEHLIDSFKGTTCHSQGREPRWGE